MSGPGARICHIDILTGFLLCILLCMQTNAYSIFIYYIIFILNHNHTIVLNIDIVKSENVFVII